MIRCNFATRPAQSKRAFTLTDLLAVVAVIALLAVTLLPALGGTKRNSRLAECLLNLRQIGTGCAVYANDFNDWYPIWGGYDSAHPVNHINGIWYTRYVYVDSGPASGDVMPASYQTGQGPYRGWDENLGYLYAGGMIPDAHALYCPAFGDAGPASFIHALSAQFYSPGADPSITQFPSTHINETIRSSYMFNPRLQSPAWGNYRKYQKTTDVKQSDVLCMDYLTNITDPSGTTGSGTGVPFTPDGWAHWPAKGWPAGFTDGSARFCTLTPTLFNAIVNSLDSTGTFGALQYDVIFNGLQSSP